MDYTVHRILQTRILEWVAFPFSGGSFQHRGQTQASCTAGGFFTSWTTREATNTFTFFQGLTLHWTSLVAQMVKRLSTMQETQVGSQGQEDPLEKEMAAHSSTIAWKIPWTEEPGRLQSMWSQRVRHDWATPLYCRLGSGLKECYG